MFLNELAKANNEQDRQTSKKFSLPGPWKVLLAKKRRSFEDSGTKFGFVEIIQRSSLAYLIRREADN